MMPVLSPGASGGQCKVGIGASSSTSSPASEDDADLAAVTARCIISRTPSFDEPPLPPGPLLLPPLPLALPTEPELLPAPELLVTPSGKMTRETESVYLRTFMVNVSGHPYCTRNSHAMSCMNDAHHRILLS